MFGQGTPGFCGAVKWCFRCHISVISLRVSCHSLDLSPPWASCNSIGGLFGMPIDPWKRQAAAETAFSWINWHYFCGSGTANLPWHKEAARVGKSSMICDDFGAGFRWAGMICFDYVGLHSLPCTGVAEVLRLADFWQQHRQGAMDGDTGSGFAALPSVLGYLILQPVSQAWASCQLSESTTARFTSLSSAPQPLARPRMPPEPRDARWMTWYMRRPHTSD